MLHFKHPDTGQVFAYETLQQRDQLGAPELVMASQEDLDALAPSAPELPPAEQIDALEREFLLARPVRDVLLGLLEKEAVAQGAGQGLTSEQSVALLRERNPGYRKVKELDEQIDALRERI